MSNKKNELEVEIKIPEFLGVNTLEEVLKLKTTKDQSRDNVSKSAPSQVTLSAEECKKLCEKSGIEYREGYENRVLSYICSDESVDRYGDIVRQKGWDLENYKKNPVVMLNHDYSQMPIGSGLKVWVDKDAKQLKMWILFPDSEVSPEADKAFRLAKAGFMKASSVGFLPLKTSELSIQEKEGMGMTPWGVEFVSQELLEHTLCGIPANPNALQEAIAKGVIKRDELDSWVKNKSLIAEIKTVSVEEEEVVEPGPIQKPTTPENPTEPIHLISPEMLEKTLEKILDSREKAGAVLSKKNKQVINDALSALATAQKALSVLLEASTSDTSDEVEEEETSEDKAVSSTSDSDILDFDVNENGTDGDDMYALDLLKNCFNDTITKIKKEVKNVN